MSAGDPVSAGSVREAETVTESVAESVIDAVPGAHMRREIAQQPACYERLLADRSQVRAVAQALADRDVRFVLIAAREPAMAGVLWLAISQSGGSPDLLEAARVARAAGAVTVAVTNAADSPVARAAELHFDIDAAQERSVAATKTYTALHR